jgi:hypothetical protein
MENMTMKKLLLAMLLLASSLGVNAQENQHWQCDVYKYEYDMAVYFQLYKDELVITDYSDYEIAAFVGEECRGVAEFLSNPSEEQYGYIRIQSNETTGETVTFRVYQRSTKKIFFVTESVEFVNMALEGMPSTPMALHMQGMLGDANADGAITSQDASLVLQLVAKKILPTAEGVKYDAADVNGDGVVTAQDASLILQYVAKKISC